MTDTIRINLTQGKSVLLDATDWPMAKSYTWYALYDSKSDTFYAVTKLPSVDGIRRVLGLHRLVMGDPPGVRIDHKNRDTLDCRKVNLRIADGGQNRANSRVNRNNQSGYRGVYARRDIPNYYVVYISTGTGGKTRFIGAFSDPIKAAYAYDDAAREMYGEFASLNFPNPEEINHLFHGEPIETVEHRATRRDNTSGYRGVTKDNRVKTHDVWVAQITGSGKTRRIGSFGTAEEAARAYDKAAQEAFGSEAKLNFRDS